MIIIDRFEGDLAVLESDSGDPIVTERTRLPLRAKVGDVLVATPDGYTIDEEETARRKKDVLSRYRGMLRRRKEK